MNNQIFNIFKMGVNLIKKAWNEMKVCIQESISKEDVEELKQILLDLRHAKNWKY